MALDVIRNDLIALWDTHNYKIVVHLLVNTMPHTYLQIHKYSDKDINCYSTFLALSANRSDSIALWDTQNYKIEDKALDICSIDILKSNKIKLDIRQPFVKTPNSNCNFFFFCNFASSVLNAILIRNFLNYNSSLRKWK